MGAVACVFAEPGTVVTHAAVALAARVGTLFVWTGEGGVRLYASGQPGGARSERILHQARLALDGDLRLRVVRRMYALRFGEEPPARRSVDQLRGLEHEVTVSAKPLALWTDEEFLRVIQDGRDAAVIKGPDEG